MIASTFGGVHDFFHSSTWYVVRNLGIFFVIVFWVASVYWVFKDARRRIADKLIVGVVTAIGVVPVIGPLIYMLFRPPEYLEDVRERELEMRAIESRIGSVETKCRVCGYGTEPDFLVCPVCTSKLRSPCAKCERPLEPSWQVCPYCATPVPPGVVTGEDVLQPVRPRRARRSG